MTDEIKNIIHSSFCENITIERNDTLQKYYNKNCSLLMDGLLNLGYVRISSKIK